jgi:PAS domain S-box-containing protein
VLSSSLLGEVLEAAPDAVVIVDAAGHIVYANRQLQALFGHDRDALMGADIDVLLPERFRSRHGEHRQRFMSGGGRLRTMGSGMELRALHRSGSEFPVEISLSPIQDGDRLLVAAAIRDVTQHELAAGELLEARLAADRANSAKSRFLAMASHDLRQPLQSLGLLNGSLRRMVRDPEALEALAQQEQAIESMSRLLNALLDISKLESGAIRADLADFAVLPLFTQLCREFAPLAADKQLELRCSGRDCNARSDPALVTQVLRNLLTNAIKYTAQGHVELRCAVTTDRVLIEVADTGIGIAAEHLDAICDEFYQVGVAANASREGYGLGLSIVKRLVTLLGLEFTIRSEPGLGSVFGIGLPLARQSALPAAPVANVAAPVPTAPPRRRHRILLVEDDAGVRDATRLLLKVEGYDVVATASPDAALAQIGADPRLDLLVTDFHLGSAGSGLDVLHALRDRLGTAFNTIIVTGDTSTAMRELPHDERLRLLSKPVHADALLALVRELLPAG